MTGRHEAPPAGSEAREATASPYAGKRRDERKQARCDDNCGAFDEPKTIAECLAAVGHWKYHRHMGGCAHGG